MRKIAKIVIWTIGIILIGIGINVIPNEGICDSAASYGLVPAITVPVINVNIDAVPTADSSHMVTTTPWVCNAFIFQLINGGIGLMLAVWLIAHFLFPDTKPKNH